MNFKILIFDIHLFNLNIVKCSIVAKWRIKRWTLQNKCSFILIFKLNFIVIVEVVMDEIYKQEKAYSQH